MYILAIETTGPWASVAIIDEKENILMETSKDEMNHLKSLMPMASVLIERAGISKSQLCAVGASIGPGSFTGIRIGVSSARAIAQSLDIPCISVPTLDSFKVKAEKDKVITPIFNARRGQVYAAAFDHTGKDIVSPGAYILKEFLQKLNGKNDLFFYGDGIDAYGDMIASYRVAQPDERYQNAEMTAKYALDKYKGGETIGYNELLPDYMRIPEAEQKLKDGSLQKAREAKMAKFKLR